MSEEQPPSAPEQPAPAPSPAPEPESAPPAQASPVPRKRLVILGAAALAVIALLVVAIVVFGKKHTPTTHPLVLRNDGGAAIHAPIGPKIPGQHGVALTGVVVDGAGLAVAGATIEAELEKGMPDRALATADAGVAPTGDAGVAALASAPTGTDGKFVVDGLDAGRYRLRVTGLGLLAAEVRMVPVPSDELRIVVARQVDITGIVTDGGKPVANANVGIRGDAIGGTLDTKSDSAGKFSVPNLPEGRYQVYAYKGPLAARTIRVARMGAGPFQPVELRLEAGQNVSGRVIDRGEGTGLVAAIELRPTGEDQAPRYARSNDDGSFIIEGVPNGQWIADAYSPGYISPGGVELTAGQAIVELAMDRGATIEGRVLDGEGHPIENAAVRALTSGQNPTEISALVEQDQLRRFSGRTAAPVVSSANSFTSDPEFIPRGELGVTVGPIPPIPPPGVIAARPASVIDPKAAGASLLGDPPPLATDPDRASIWTTGGDGRYRIRGLTKAKLSVLAVASGYAEGRSKDISIGNGQVILGVDIILSAGTFIVGRVTDKRGGAVVGAQITAQPEIGLPLDAFSDDDGMYRIGPTSGKIDLVASAYGYVETHRHVDLAPAKGRTAAEQHEDIVLEIADATLAGTLDDTAGAPIPGANIEIISGPAAGRHAVVATDGTFSIDMLPSGPVRIRVDHPSYPADELDATATTTDQRVRLRLSIGGQIEGVLIDGSTGNPQPGMTIDARGPGGRTADATSDDKGLFKLGALKPGKWKIEVKQPGYLALTKDVDVPASRAPGEASVRDVRLELQRGAILHGTVRDRRGQRVAGATVTIERADGVGEPVDTETNDQGEFTVHDAPTGDIRIEAKLGDAIGSEHTAVRPGGEVLTLAIEIR